MISSVYFAYNRVSRVKDWVSEDCDTICAWCYMCKGQRPCADSKRTSLPYSGFLRAQATVIIACVTGLQDARFSQCLI